MNILESLKTIGLHFPNLKNIKFLNFSLNIDRSVHVHADGSTLTVNPEQLPAKQRSRLLQIIRTDMLDESGAIVDQSSAATIAALLDAFPSIEDSAGRFSAIIPSSDIPLLKACLFLRKRFEAGVAVEDLKGQIARSYGPRGRNLANLCSAGYLETWFWPLYEHLLTVNPGDPSAAKLKFQVLYGNILSELPFTEFVSLGHSAAKTLSHIVEKMKRNIQNGVRFLNVHGLGKRNVTKIVSVLPEIIKQTGARIVREEKDDTHIFIRLEIPPKGLVG
jgi:hypothetical protein